MQQEKISSQDYYVDLQKYTLDYKNGEKKVIDDLIENWKGQSREIYKGIQLFESQNESLKLNDFLQFKYQTPLVKNIICQKIFNQGEKLYYCNLSNSQIQSSVFFMFNSGDHKGHNFFIFKLSGGGCCDCGDENAWDMKGTCLQHIQRTSHQQIQKTIMSQTKQKFNSQIGFCITYLITRYNYSRRLWSDYIFNSQTLIKKLASQIKIQNWCIPIFQRIKNQKYAKNCLQFNSQFEF